MARIRANYVLCFILVKHAVLVRGSIRFILVGDRILRDIGNGCLISIVFVAFGKREFKLSG